MNGSAVLHGIRAPVRRARRNGGQCDFSATYVSSIEAPESSIAAAREKLGARVGREAIAAELRRRGMRLEWGEAEPVADTAEFLDHMDRWGRESLYAVRRDPTLLRELQIGRWFAPEITTRLRVRITLRLLEPANEAVRLRLLEQLPLDIGAPAAFWNGVRRQATAREWRRFTHGYVVLLYHRLAGADVPGQERLDVPTSRFRRDLALLQRLGFLTVDAEELCRFHDSAGGDLGPCRRCVVTVDDAFVDVVAPLSEAAFARPQLFVPTANVGSRAAWLGGEPVADWGQLRSLQRLGVTLGSHTRTHASLPDIPDEQLNEELAGSRDDLGAATGQPASLLAYPHGRSNQRVRAAAAAAGYALAYTTTPGVNGAGSDPYALSRVSVKGWDSRTALVWKAVTGSPVPHPWERWLLRRHGAARALRAALRSGRRLTAP